MSSYVWSPLISGSGGVTIYSSFSAFPAASAVPAGTLGVAADTGILYESNNTVWSAIGSPGAALSVGTLDSGTASANGAHIDSTALIMQSASATRPGLVNTTSQTLAGSKTLNSLLNADGGIDRSTAGTLTIGATNSTIINIGNSGSTVNIQGTTIYENTPHLLVADPLITVNSGGGAGSGQNSGIEVEENAIVTGYLETSSDRNSWIVKAPNTAGIITLTPGASGFTIDQASHNPVTLGAFGSTANSSGASLSTQVLTLQPADASNPGGVSTTTQTFAGNKTFSGSIAASNFSGTSSGTNTGDITLAAVGSSPSANGASLSGQALTLQPADGTRPGVMTAGTQTLGGAKTFSAAMTLSSGLTLTGAFLQKGSSSGTLTTQAAATTTDYTITWPAVQGTAISSLINDGSGGITWIGPNSADMRNVGISCSVGSSALTINLLTGLGATPTADNPISIIYRNATAATGTFGRRLTTAATSLVVSSGSTLGQASATAQDIYVYAIDDGSNTVLGVSSAWFNTDSLVSTTAEGGAGAATSNSVMYSASTLSNRPCRLIARLISNQTTAGTWAAVPTQVSLTPINGRQAAARATTTAGQSITNGATPIVVNFGTVSYDSRNSVATGAGWTYTIPEAGNYQINAVLAFATNTFTATNSLKMYLYVAGSVYCLLGKYFVGITGNQSPVLNGSALITNIAAGQTLDIRVVQDESTARSLGTTAGDNMVFISKVGI